MSPLDDHQERYKSGQFCFVGTGELRQSRWSVVPPRDDVRADRRPGGARVTSGVSKGSLGCGSAGWSVTGWRDPENNTQGGRRHSVGSIPDPAGDDWAFGALVLALRDLNDQVRVSAASGLGYTGRVDAVAPLVALAADLTPRVRSMVAYALGRLGSHEATPALQRLLHDPDRHVRENAAEAPARSEGRPRSMHCWRWLPTKTHSYESKPPKRSRRRTTRIPAWRRNSRCWHETARPQYERPPSADSAKRAGTLIRRRRSGCYVRRCGTPAPLATTCVVAHRVARPTRRGAGHRRSRVPEEERVIGRGAAAVHRHRGACGEAASRGCLAYVSPAGRAMIDGRLPPTRDDLVRPLRPPRPPRRRRRPAGPRSSRNPALARQMVTAVLNAGVRVGWVTGDEVYGAGPWPTR
ncbi:HEAT repeat domain-containing protein [Micromonospora zamorensis]|uniref:HEAT repeat domain-containing protein n=1 Tax=Micromonospora zamorensis TaxID=709883 RepID=UPI0033DDAC86